MSQLLCLLIVSDQHLERQCLAIALAATERFRILECSGGIKEALVQIAQQLPQVVIADWNLPDQGALNLTSQVVGGFPLVKVLLLGLPETHDILQMGLKAGAVGFVSRNETFDQLVVRVDQIVRGETAGPPTMARSAFACLNELAQERRKSAPSEVSPLTFREMEILRLIADGLSNKQIAGRLSLSLHTVKNHIHNLLEKLCADGRYSAVRYAYQKQWLKH
jgi:two-component system NarL family response regulator